MACFNETEGLTLQSHLLPSGYFRGDRIEGHFAYLYLAQVTVKIVFIGLWYSYLAKVKITNRAAKHIPHGNI